ncbi:MAG: DsbA family protein, partial [Candidatus Micrarchaeota archaeon]|nr:DsbA family protein [Candidatus Micrarchaeota archaeon]
SDYQCPFCRIFATQTMAQIQKDYIDAGKVQFYFVDFPLAFHSMAHVSAQAARCAGKLGTYWRMHDKMFAEQAESGSGTAEYSVDDLKAWARQIGLDGPSFEACLDSGRFADVVDASYDAVLDAGISGTPSFYINGQLLVGAQPYSAFRDAIDAALAG